MEDRPQLFFRSLTVMMGGIIGVGIYGLPYAFSRAGALLSLVELLLVAVSMLVMLLAYSELILQFPGRPRLKSVIGRYLGAPWSHLATLAFIVGAWGALLSYTIVGGTFLHAILSPWLGGLPFWYQLTFFAICAFMLIGGLGFVSRLEVVFISLMMLVLAIIVIGALPYFDVSHLATINWDQARLPFGVILFATAGLGVIPEVADVLGKQKHLLLKKTVWTGSLLITAIYAIFSLTVVAVSGSRTSPEGIIGLGPIVGSWMVDLASIIGLVTLFSSFMMLGLEIINTLTFDFRRRYLWSWLAAVGVPLFAFLFGARNFIKVISFTGGFSVGLVGLLLVTTYLQAKKHPSTAKRSLSLPTGALYFCGLIYLLALGLTIFG